ncbi:BQ5605_C002g01037 [Microbotryum silenes-dioicae]|uniref:BQ5605_C002g01037 protein n=1 Tax=Microbotryum silenes-dioicae TaxID=796604 RepID=A0A2X0MSH2_9BASI|nr:BQ5605_C002g01037 [Microbotryum silenes-dioicae]
MYQLTTKREYSCSRCDQRCILYTHNLQRCREKSVITVANSGASSIVDASRRASSRIDVGHLPHSRPDIEVTTDFRQ